MSDSQLISSIFHLIRNKGTLKNEAKSCWGADVWELGNIWASLEDDGSTQRIEAEGFSLDVRNTCGRIKFVEGSRLNLQRLYDSILG